MNSSTLRIGGALFFGLLLVTVAYVYKDKRQIKAEESALITAEQNTRTYIAEQDKNNNGIPDWQEMLVKTVVLENATTTDWEAETLTEQFSLIMFEAMMQNQMNDLNPLEATEIANIGAASADTIGNDTLYTLDAINIIEADDPQALKKYGNDLAQITLDHPTDLEPEIIIFERAITNNDPTELEKLDQVILDYKSVIAELKLITVPRRFAGDHLLLLNLYNAVLKDTIAMREVFNDPLVALIRMKRYEQDMLGAIATTITIFELVLELEDVSFSANDPIMILVNTYLPQQ